MRIGRINIWVIFLSCIIASPLVMGSELAINDVYKGPKPLFVLVEDDPTIWRQAPLDPTFIVYENGLVLYRKDPYLSTPYYFVNLDQKSLEELKSKLIDERIFQMEAVYSVIEGDMSFKGVRNEFHFFDQGRSKEIRVDTPTPYFFDKENEVHFKSGFWQDKDVQRLPELIRHVFETAKSFKSNDAKLWKSEQLEILYKSNSGKIPPAWESFPCIPRPKINFTTIGEYYNYSIYVPAKDIKKIIKESKNSDSGRIFQIRNVYPNDSMWGGWGSPKEIK
ncbi:MAG: hypothetical protein WCH62_08050 [Candidatus Omnitrophota bacterium]